MKNMQSWFMDQVGNPEIGSVRDETLADFIEWVSQSTLTRDNFMLALVGLDLTSVDGRKILKPPAERMRHIQVARTILLMGLDVQRTETTVTLLAWCEGVLGDLPKALNRLRGIETPLASLLRMAFLGRYYNSEH